MLAKDIKDETSNFNKTEGGFRSRMEVKNRELNNVKRELNGLKRQIDGESQKIPENEESPWNRKHTFVTLFMITVYSLLFKLCEYLESQKLK